MANPSPLKISPGRPQGKRLRRKREKRMAKRKKKGDIGNGAKAVLKNGGYFHPPRMESMQRR